MSETGNRETEKNRQNQQPSENSALSLDREEWPKMKNSITEMIRQFYE